jgi:hypothetical protein
MNQPDGELSLDQATLDLVAKPTSPLLKAFYQVRKGKPEAGWPKKGQVKDTENGAVTLITLAFSCRCDSVVEIAVAPELVETATAEEVVKLAFNPDQMVHFADLNATALQPQVDTLRKIIWSRLQYHIMFRVNETKHDSWVLSFVRENLGPVAAMMILVGHVQSHLLGIVDRGHVCLLRNPVEGGKMIPLLGEDGSRTNAAKILQGCCLHFDREKGIWIRSGKATG